MEEDRLPFFDIGNILFSSIVREWKDQGKNCSLEQFFYDRGWIDVIKNSLKLYSNETNISIKLLEYLPGLVMIRQFTKVFPDSRDPKDYPLFDADVFSEMLSLKLDLSDE